MRIEELGISINPINDEKMIDARNRQDFRVKVPGSLGGLEDISIRLAGITGNVTGNDVSKQAIVLMCADNGVVEEGVASAPQTVTQMQTINFTRKVTGVGSQAKYFDIDLLTVDIGVKLPLPKELLTDSMLEEKGKLTEKIVNRRIADGTKNLAKEPAMTREEAIKSILIGIEAARSCVKAGKNIIGVGEMGIGNTTTATAIISGLSGVAAREVVGRGGGLSDEGLQKKEAVVENAISRFYSDCRAKGLKIGEAPDPIDLLAAVGGFDIGGMVGVYLGAAASGVPVVIDGLISMAAAILAVRIAPLAKDYMFASHKSKEAGYEIACKTLGLKPMFDLGMRLGEGSGCPIAFKIIEAAVAVMDGMESLEEAQVDGKYLDEFRRDGQFK